MKKSKVLIVGHIGHESTGMSPLIAAIIAEGKSMLHQIQDPCTDEEVGIQASLPKQSFELTSITIPDYFPQLGQEKRRDRRKKSRKKNG